MTTVVLSDAQVPFTLVVDIGSSSLRAMLFDGQAREVEGTRARRTYNVRTTDDGGSELDAEAMFEAFTAVLDEAMAKSPGVKIAAVATSSLASSLVGLDAEGRVLTPVYLYSDTRNAGAVEELRARVDWAPMYERTGAPLHTSYLPARFWWLRQTQPEVFARAAHWLSLHEFLLLRLFGRSVVSHSLASWTGMLNRVTLDWDDELLALVGVRREQLSPLVSAKESLRDLQQTYERRWPALAGVPFFPAIGDGATANLGSGCTDPQHVAITIGTSGAMRVVMPDTPDFRIPRGLWLYRVDERRGLLGGSLNNGGNVYAYLCRALQLPENEARELEAMPPDAHGLTVLPFFAGERSTGYHGEARATISGLSLDTSPLDILRACFEAIAYRVAAIYELLRAAVPPPEGIIASGSALLNSHAWVQILADVLGQPVTASGEEEASARGAALLALEALGAIHDVADLPPALGRTFVPDAENCKIYARARERQERLYAMLIGKG